MARMEASVVINRPIDEVFAYIIDVSNWPEWTGFPEAEQTSEGPVGVGTTCRGVTEFMGRRGDWTSEVTEHFNIPALVCINKSDINLETTLQISDYCARLNIDVVGVIPFDTVVTEAMVHGKPVTAHEDGPVTKELRRVWERVQASLGTS